MLRDLLKHVEKEITAVNTMIERQLTNQTGDMSSLLHLESHVDQTIRPMLTVLAARLYTRNTEKAVALAAVFQLVHIATMIQEGVSENDTDGCRGKMDPLSGSQFPVLVGDYLYGKAFELICQAGITSVLQKMAEIVCHVHEGALLEKRINGCVSVNGEYLEVVRKKTAELFAGCCMLGASLAGAPDEEKYLLEQFGGCVGMAYGLLGQPNFVEHVDAHCTRAQEIVRKLPNKPERKTLEQIVSLLSSHGLKSRRMVI